MLLFKNREYKNIISENTEFAGNINAGSSLRIDGKFTGSIVVKDEVKLSHYSDVSADITAKSCYVEGTFAGDVNLEEEIEIASGAKFYGHITARKIIFNQGAELVLKQITLIAKDNEKTSIRTDS